MQKQNILCTAEKIYNTLSHFYICASWGPSLKWFVLRSIWNSDNKSPKILNLQNCFDDILKLVFRVSHHSGINKSNNKSTTLSKTKNKRITSNIGSYKWIFITKKRVLGGSVINAGAKYTRFFDSKEANWLVEFEVFKIVIPSA